jgi:peptide chain release factor 1
MDDSTEKKEYVLNRNDVDRKYTRGSGNGGQNRNKVETVVVLTHLPTGTIVRCEEHSTRGKNEETAWARLAERLGAVESTRHERVVNQSRASQIGCGERGDKRRTYRIQDGIVKDDISGKTISVKDLYKGRIDLLHVK